MIHVSAKLVFGWGLPDKLQGRTFDDAATGSSSHPCSSNTAMDDI